jgi:transposase
MLDYLMVLRMRYVQNLSSREICRTIGCGKTTVNDFIKRFGNCVDLSFPLESSVDNETIHRMLYKDKALRSEDFALPDFEKIYRSIPKKGETLKRIWRQYSRQTNQGSLHAYSYRQFCHLYDKWLDVRNVTAPITRYPAQNTELDYAGKSMWLKNKLTGESDTRVTVFLATMSYSNHTYGEGLTNCGIANWIGVNNHAVRFFGGTTPLTTNDNCKVAVIQNKDWIDPTLNRDFKDWADHFHTYLAPARVSLNFLKIFPLKPETPRQNLR